MAEMSDLAFDAVDEDNSGSLDKQELTQVLKDVAKRIRIYAPTENDILAMLSELDQDDD